MEMILHPIFLLIFGVLLFLMLAENLSAKTYKSLLIFACVLMVVGAGGREWVGADYPIYRGMYETGFPQYTTYLDVWHKATFQRHSMEIEWLYVLVSKIMYDLGFSFVAFTMVLSFAAIVLLYKIFTRFSLSPALSFLIFYIPTYFVAVSGQMREGIGGILALYAFIYVVERKLGWFLFMMFLSLGLHKSTIILLPAYWLIHIRWGIWPWMMLVAISIILAPFEVFRLFGGLIENLMPTDVSGAYSGYLDDSNYGQTLKTGFSDALILFYVGMMVVFNSEGEARVPYYEYFRSFSFAGICLFYLLRGNMIFATRLPWVYINMAPFFALPGIFMVVRPHVKRFLKIMFFGYSIFFYFLFARKNGIKGNFTYDQYRNVLWK